MIHRLLERGHKDLEIKKWEEIMPQVLRLEEREMRNMDVIKLSGYFMIMSLKLEP